MNREEILAKSRQESFDEGMWGAETRGKYVGEAALMLVQMAIVLFNWATGQPNYVPFAMLWAFLAAEAYPKYKFSQKKIYLVTAIFGVVLTALFLACHVITVLNLK